MTFRTIRRSAAAMALALAAGAASAQLQEANRSVVANVDLKTQRDLMAVSQIAENIWSCRIGVGPLDVQLDAADLATLDALGLDYEVRIHDVDRLIALERQSINELRQLRGISWYETFRTNTEFNDYITNELLARFGPAGTQTPGLLTTEVIGQSVEGRDITALRLNPPGTTANTRPAIFLNGGQHAREWVNHATTMYIAEFLMDGYGSDPRITNILDNLEFLIVPITNPDGYEYSWQSGGTRLWRKNRRNNGDGTFGVDLNRNWDIFHGGPGADNITSSDIYHGPFAFSEPETSALRDLHNSHPNVVAHIDIHSFSQLILWPWGYGFVTAPDETFLSNLGNAMSQAIQSKNGAFYTPQQSVDLYPASGTCSDWFYDQGVFSYTFELRDTGSFGFVLPPDQIIPTAEENFEAILVMGDTFLFPLSVSQIGAAPLTVAPQTDIALTFSATGTYGTLDTASGLLFSRVNGGAWTSTALAAVGDNYDGLLPGGDCGDVVEYYAQFSTTTGEDVTFPSDIANPIAINIEDSETVLVDDLETTPSAWDPGRPGDTATTGVWELADPVGTGAQPEDDHTPGAGTLCFVTGASGGGLGANDVDGGFTTLLSPTLDAVNGSTLAGGDAFVRYFRSYSNDQGASPNADTFTIEISNDDGANWTTLELVNASANAWIESTHRVSDTIAPTSTMRLRFIAEDAGGGSIVEAAIDDLEIFFTGCATPQYSADLTTTGGNNGVPDGVVDLSDFSYYLGLWASGDPTADITTTGTSNGVPDMTVDLSDFSFYLGEWSAQAD